MPPEIAAPSAAPLYTWLAGLVSALLVGVGTVVWRRLDANTKEMADQTKILTRLDTAIRGINGDNGLVGDVKDLKRRVGRLERGGEAA